MSRNPSWSAVTATVLALTVALGVAPSAGSAEGRRILGTRTVFRITEPSFLDVRIPRDTTIERALLRVNDDVRISGDGRFVGMLLTQARGTFDPRHSRTILVGDYRLCAEQGCSAKPHHITYWIGFKEFGKRLEVPAGDYRLYLINDGAPARVTLDLEGLSPGTTTVAPLPHAQVQVGTPTMRLSSAPLTNIYSGGDSQRMTSPTFSWTAVWFSGSPGGVRDLGTCNYKGPPPGEERFAYRSDCYSKGAKGKRSFTIEGSSSFSEGLFDVRALSPGVWSRGAYLQSTAVMPEGGALTLTVGY